MDKEDVIADTVLRRLAKEEKLKAVISNTFTSYIRSIGNIELLGVTFGMLALGYLAYTSGLPASSLIVYALLICLFIDNRRQKERLDALIELIEMSNDSKTANQTIEPTGDTRSGFLCGSE